MTVNVLISVPSNNPRHAVYLPAIWGILKTYAETHSAKAGAFTWLEPVIQKDRAERLLAPYRGTEIHVLGLSCYSWNADTNLSLAAHVRAKHPGCLIVAGGPHLDYRNLDFFALYPQVDAIVLKDGEIPFTTMLEQVADGRVNLDDVPGLILPPTTEARARGETYRATRPPELPAVFDETSPWLANGDYFEALIARLVAENPTRSIGIPWEIDRGCPYGCAFCDWGSNTSSAIRPVPLERVKREVEWIARRGIQVCFITVANFGIVARDEEILESMIAAKEAYGRPNVYIWNNAKMDVDRVVTMNARAFAAGLVNYHVLSVQSLDDDVLKAMRRASVSKSRLMRVIRHVNSTGMPCVAQLIFGAPNDSPDKFLNSITGLMELGVHSEFVAYPFDIIPNSPAGQPDYRKNWQIRTITRVGAVNKRDPNLAVHDYSTIIVATNSYDESDFVRMYIHGRLIIALHNSGLTQPVSRYLRRSRAVSFRTFYDRILERMFVDPSAEWHPVYKHCHDHISAFVFDDDMERMEALPIEDMPDFDYLMNIEEYFQFKFFHRADKFFQDLRRVVEEEFGQWDELDSILDYSRQMIIDPSYDRRTGRMIRIRHDWPAYLTGPDQEVAEPVSRTQEVLLKTGFSGSRFQYPLDWWERSNDPYTALKLWTRTVVGKHYERVERSFFTTLDDISSRERFSRHLNAAPTSGNGHAVIGANDAGPPVLDSIYGTSAPEYEKIVAFRQECGYSLVREPLDDRSVHYFACQGDKIVFTVRVSRWSDGRVDIERCFNFTPSPEDRASIITASVLLSKTGHAQTIDLIRQAWAREASLGRSIDLILTRERLVPYYERMGYRTIGKATVPHPRSGVICRPMALVCGPGITGPFAAALEGIDAGALGAQVEALSVREPELEPAQ